MEAASIMDRYRLLRYSFFRWRYGITIIQKLGLAFAMATFTGILALIRIPLPFTPVPITGQVLGVLLSGVICGATFGSISQLIYVVLGIAAGIPWFAGGTTCTWDILSIPTGGYLIGFILAPAVIGRYTDRYIGARSFPSQLKYMMIGVAIIYLPGTIVLSSAIKSGFWETVSKGAAPFIFVDLFKAAISAGISSSILPKASYNGEADKTEYI